MLKKIHNYCLNIVVRILSVIVIAIVGLGDRDTIKITMPKKINYRCLIIISEILRIIFIPITWLNNANEKDNN